MLPASHQRIETLLSGDETVLDVGGWAKPLARADWVIDLMPFETRGRYGRLGEGPERFTRETWVQRDVCDRAPWPFEDGEFDFVVCSHTLEDVRDPVWVCSEMQRVGGAGYIEVPSRLEEQSAEVHGPWVGWSHHHWLVDVTRQGIEFVFKSAVLQGRPECALAPELGRALTAEERVQTLFWQGGFDARERVFVESAELDRYLAEGIATHRARLDARLERKRPTRLARLRRRVREAVRGDA